ncbi:hypothetical protein DXQ71_20595 [Salmonella enterica]|nr:hypothetical protein [Salmonella enterica]EAT3592619.1 hypothetical protein [Salmonella enterica]EBK8723631.1 hypothetical protein [Salmonella enterica]EBN5344280.1 hypothetical protein [Salmonella enterica]EBN6694111.1 hypothetical protein [Salmonella enterica]
MKTDGAPFVGRLLLVRQAQTEGLKLTDLIQKYMDDVRNDAWRPDTTPYTMDECINEKTKFKNLLPRTEAITSLEVGGSFC